MKHLPTFFNQTANNLSPRCCRNNFPFVNCVPRQPTEFLIILFAVNLTLLLEIGLISLSLFTSHTDKGGCSLQNWTHNEFFRASAIPCSVTLFFVSCRGYFQLFRLFCWDLTSGDNWQESWMIQQNQIYDCCSLFKWRNRNSSKNSAVKSSRADLSLKTVSSLSRLNTPRVMTCHSRQSIKLGDDSFGGLDNESVHTHSIVTRFWNSVEIASHIGCGSRCAFEQKVSILSFANFHLFLFACQKFRRLNTENDSTEDLSCLHLVQLKKIKYECVKAETVCGRLKRGIPCIQFPSSIQWNLHRAHHSSAKAQKSPSPLTPPAESIFQGLYGCEMNHWPLFLQAITQVDKSLRDDIFIFCSGHSYLSPASRGGYV